MIRPNWNIGAGRPPKVRFPIVKTIVYRGNELIRKIEENTTVLCIRCGEPFLINSDTAYRIRHPLDESPYIRCPHCGYRVAVYYYLDQAEEVKKE